MNEKTTALIEQSKTTGEWSWFCEREGCHWSGHGWMSESGARREWERHECRSPSSASVCVGETATTGETP